MLDVHILTMPSTPRNWAKQCISSVEEAIASTPGVHLHVIEGVPGHIGKGRAAGYALGTAPWKTYVDHDDYVLPHAFQKLLEYLDKDVAAVFPREHIEQNGRLHSFTRRRHHLQTYRADLVQSFDHAAWAAVGDVIMRRLAETDSRGVIEIDEPLYVHRVYMKSGGRILRNLHNTEVEKARLMV